jgi:starvation-inducible DNA-binding protein
MEELQKAAKVAFASTFCFYLKAHNFHWNIIGSDFLQYHELFGKIYDEVYGSIDDFAEKIRSLDTFVPGSLARFSMLTLIDDETEILDQDRMLMELAQDNEKMIKLLKIVYDASEQNGEYGFSNFLAERIDAHKKHGWMLKASMQY